MNDIIRVLEGADFQKTGRYFLYKACKLIAIKDFNKASVLIKLGLDLVTCDCARSWKTDIDRKFVFNDIDIQYHLSHDYFLCKAFILSYETSLQELYLASEAIDKYNEVNNDHYGFYVKGRILLSMGQYHLAIEFFEKSQNICSSARNLYKIGRTREEYTDEFGLDELYQSYMNNMYSVCCGSALQRNSLKRGYKFDLSHDFNKENELSKAFCESNEAFVSLLNKCINNDHTYLNSFLCILFSNDFIFSKLVDEVYSEGELYTDDFEAHNHVYNDEYIVSVDDDYLGVNDWYDGNRRGSSENPWEDVFGPGEEADAAYWNTE